jgi:NADPH-dependent 2,4-dienoyl-CoA reductase/sulfur reductase-like enzyme/nitrite reductase/ring-hydroxylating ferredoxin subunit
MEAGDWRKAGKEEAFLEGIPKLVEVGEDAVHLLRLDGRIYAVGNKCPHYECGLDEGALIGGEIVCKCHDARFDARTGVMLSAPALKDLPTFPVRTEDGEVWIGPVEKARAPKVEVTDPRVFIIVGGGAAGNAAAETLRREGFAGRVVILSAEADPPYDRPNLSKEFAAGTAKAEWMPLRSPKFYEGQKIELLTGTRVVAVDPAKKTVTTAAGITLAFDKLLLATGADPVKVPIAGGDGPGCFVLRSFADGRAIAAAAEGAKKAVLVGAGFIGLELASSFRERGLEVVVAAPERVLLGNILGERVGNFLRKKHEENGVVFKLGVAVERVSGNAGAKIVTLSDGTALEADFVVFGTGVRPSVDYLAGTDLVVNGEVPVNSRLETANPDILAAGDIARIPSAMAGAGQRIEHWVVAEREGQHAARSMLGSKAAYDEVPFFWTRQHKLGLHYVGFTREWDELAVRGDIEAGKFLVGYYMNGTLRAAAGIGMSNALTAVEYLLRRNAPPSAAQLADPSFDLLGAARR